MMSRMSLSSSTLNVKNTIMKSTLITLGALAFATSITFAEPPAEAPEANGKGKKPTPEEVFAKLDANSDGNVSLEEFKQSPKAKKNEAKAGEMFLKIDGNSDGNITLEEFKAHRPPHDGPRKGGKPGEKGNKGEPAGNE